MGRKPVPVHEGDRYGRLVVRSVFPKTVNGRRHHTAAIADCDCGTTGREYTAFHLHSGDTQSCGCLHRERTSAANGTHRGSKTPLYKMWLGMWTRCTNQRSRSWPRYGGRGITVCDEWTDFPVFREWAQANGYERGLSLDRMDNDGPYAPWNCQWTTNKVQSSNKRTNVWIEAFGERKTVTQWSEDPRCVVQHATLRMRLRAGRDPEDAITAPVSRSVSPNVGERRVRRIWSGIKKRCYNPASSTWANYGGRGVTMCPEWVESVEAFVAWSFANGYADDLSLDRMNSAGNYAPGNCRWATRSVQNNNTRNTLRITAFGQTMSAAEWARDPRCMTGNSSCLRRRIQDGWDHERAVTTPSMARK